MTSLASALEAQEKFGEAEAMFREVLEGQAKLFGPEHEEMLLTAHDLANTLYNQVRALHCSAHRTPRWWRVVVGKLPGRSCVLCASPHPQALGHGCGKALQPKNTELKRRVCGFYYCTTQDKFEEAEVLHRKNLEVIPAHPSAVSLPGCCAPALSCASARALSLFLLFYLAVSAHPLC